MMLDFELELKKLEKQDCIKPHKCSNCHVITLQTRNIFNDHIDIVHSCPKCHKQLRYLATKTGDGHYVSRAMNTSPFKFVE
jgi:hypothetical protein